MDVSGLLTFFVLLFAVCTLSYFIFVVFVEPVYMLLFNKPVYVHFYFFRKELPLNGQELLEDQFSFYRNLSDKRKKFFRHRISVFTETYRFIGMDGLEVTEEMKVKIAATAIMLTFGMREYLSSLFKVIIIYPDIYKSGNGEYHKGEFNPGARAVVFSWKDFQEGISFDNDNLNLGLHEFTHVMHLSAIRIKRPLSSFAIYSDMFTKIKEYIAVADNRIDIMNAGYLRDYAFTNQHEFIAVALEYFFESPQEFKQKLPELYDMIRQMINFKEG